MPVQQSGYRTVFLVPVVGECQLAFGVGAVIPPAKGQVSGNIRRVIGWNLNQQKLTFSYVIAAFKRVDGNEYRLFSVLYTVRQERGFFESFHHVSEKGFFVLKKQVKVFRNFLLPTLFNR